MKISDDELQQIISRFPDIVIQKPKDFADVVLAISALKELLQQVHKTQNECDHVVGIQRHSTLNVTFFVHQSRYWNPYKPIRNMTHLFKHCPDCGAKIDLEK